MLSTDIFTKKQFPIILDVEKIQSKADVNASSSVARDCQDKHLHIAYL